MLRSMLPLAALGALTLGGCAASLAASAVGAALRAGQKQADPNVDFGPVALEACRARASQHGDVHIIDVERRSPGNVIVWGTVQTPAERRSFDCRFNGEIAAFKLRTIAQRR